MRVSLSKLGQFSAASVAFVVGLGLSCASWAQTSTFEASLSQGLSTSQRLTRLENQVHYLSQQLAKVSSINQQISDLRGQIEMNQHTLTMLKQQLVILNQKQAEMDASKKLAAVTPKEDMQMLVKKAVPMTGKQKDVEAYHQAYNDLLKRRYPQATTAFESFLKKYPKSKLVGDAQFWLGDLYLAQGRPDKATQEFRKVANNPSNIKAPDAMYKLGMIFLANGDLAHAKEMFTKVVNNYKGTEAAGLAAKQLKSMH